jgi:ribosomal protein L37AE/L43A
MTPLIEPTVDPDDRSACPSCESDVTNVHGIYTCSTCSWVTPEHR